MLATFSGKARSLVVVPRGFDGEGDGEGHG